MTTKVMFFSVYRFGLGYCLFLLEEKSEEDTLWPLLSVCFYNMMYRGSVRGYSLTLVKFGMCPITSNSGHIYPVNTMTVRLNSF